MNVTEISLTDRGCDWRYCIDDAHYCYLYVDNPSHHSSYFSSWNVGGQQVVNFYKLKTIRHFIL